MSTEAFVTIHDQDLVIACEERGQFDAVSHTYLFVGPRPVDKVPRGTKLIVCRDLPHNVEQWPNYYDFTGWHALTWNAHRVLDPDIDHLITLQYDMHIADPDLAARVDKMLDEGPGPIAFIAGHRYAHNWMLLIPGFEQTFNAGMAVLGVDQSVWPDFNEWPCTQGTAWRTDDFVAYNRWITPLFDVWCAETYQGHLMERTVKPWTMVTGIPERYLPGVIVHEGQDCHGTCALMAGRADIHAAKQETFGR